MDDRGNLHGFLSGNTESLAGCSPPLRVAQPRRPPPAAHPYFDHLKDLHVSAHLLIDRLGGITQFVGFDRRAWHAGESSFEGRKACNDFSIGIELVGADDLPYTDKQYSALSLATAAILRTYPATTLERIVGHSNIAPLRKTDPGESFDWQKYRELLEAAIGRN